MKLIPYGKQDINYSDKLSVHRSLNQDFITSGKSVSLFEKKITKILSCKYSVVCNSGTSAIHLALISINLKKNDTVIMPSINFVAAFNICNLLGAKIYLTDVDSQSGQMTPKNLLECIKIHKLKKIKTVITSQLGGHPLNIIELYKIKNGNPFIFLDIQKLKNKFSNNPGLGSGLGSFAFHPSFQSNGLFYTTHSELSGSGKADFSFDDSISVDLQWVLTEWKTNNINEDKLKNLGIFKNI